MLDTWTPTIPVRTRRFTYQPAYNCYQEFKQAIESITFKPKEMEIKKGTLYRVIDTDGHTYPLNTIIETTTDLSDVWRSHTFKGHTNTLHQHLTKYQVEVVPPTFEPFSGSYYCFTCQEDFVKQK